ncbi:hypothetical protein ACHAWF_004478 [Thalassiosira exigua]
MSKSEDATRRTSGVKLFTTNANSLYTNVDTNHANHAIDYTIHDSNQPLPISHRRGKEAMAIVTKNNIFEFGDLFFLHFIGTVMVTSAPCMRVTIYFWAHEKNSYTLLGICIPTTAAAANVNNFGILTWEFSELSDSVGFLYLILSIENGTVVSRTYKTSINLYQYITTTYAHPPSMMKCVIYSLLHTYCAQNAKQKDNLDMAEKLFRRHVARGWSKLLMESFIPSADECLPAQLPVLWPAQTPTQPTHPEPPRNTLSSQGIPPC